MRRTFFLVSIEAIVGGIILYFSLKVFLLYGFIMLMIQAYSRTEMLRKLLSFHDFGVTCKINSIMQKLNISDEELDKSIADVKTLAGSEGWKRMKKEFGEISGKTIMD